MVDAWGVDRVAVRIAPAWTWNGMGDSNPAALLGRDAAAVNRSGPAPEAKRPA